MPSLLPMDVLDRIARDFPSVDRERIASTLRTWNLPLASPSTDERVMRCVLFACKGDIDEFTKLVKLAQRDYRDAIVAGEYGLSSDKKLTRLRNLTHAFPSD